MITKEPNTEALMALHAAVKPTHDTLSKGVPLSWEQADKIIEALDNLEPDARNRVEALAGSILELSSFIRSNINSGTIVGVDGLTLPMITDRLLELEAQAAAAANEAAQDE